jgi:hypothetical protein
MHQVPSFSVSRAFQFGSFSAFYIHSEALHNPTKNCEEKIARAGSMRSDKVY